MGSQVVPMLEKDFRKEEDLIQAQNAPSSDGMLPPVSLASLQLSSDEMGSPMTTEDYSGITAFGASSTPSLKKGITSHTVSRASWQT